MVVVDRSVCRMVSDIFPRRLTVRQKWVVASWGGGYRR